MTDHAPHDIYGYQKVEETANLCDYWIVILKYRWTMQMKKLLVALVLSFLVVHCGQAGPRIAHQDNPGKTAAQPDREAKGMAAPVRTAVQVPLTWSDPNNNPADVGGYKLYYWQDAAQKTAIDVGKQTVYTLTGLEAGQTYNFAVTAYDDPGGRESAYSNVVSQTFVTAEAKPLPAQTRGREAVDAPAKAPSQDYLIGPEDVLEILVWKNADLSKVVTVRPDGKFSLPLIGDVQAAGLTTAQLAKQILEKLLVYYKEGPHVSIIVQQANSNAFYILGEVREPGRHMMRAGITLLQGITLAKGFTEFASTNKILLLRRENGNNNKETRMTVRYKDIIAGKQDNILLKPGDTILVP
jgi:polysaccharide biosynthesis/export protein